LILNELFFYQLVLKKNHFFVNCHSTLFKWIIWTLFKNYECYVCILFEFTIKICC